MNGQILTYSNSAQIRSAMLSAGFLVGKIFNKRLNKFEGTIATKNVSLIKYPLSDFDLGLVNSKAGIFYRDENLTLENEAILLQHDNDVKNSTLMSSTKFVKQFKDNKNEKL